MKQYRVLVSGRTEPITIEADSHKHDAKYYTLKLFRDDEKVGDFTSVESWWFEDDKVSPREHVYRGTIAALAQAIYNGDNWDKQTVAGQLHLGDPALDYTYPGEPPEELTDEDVFAALDEMFEKAGI